MADTTIKTLTPINVKEHSKNIWIPAYSEDSNTVIRFELHEGGNIITNEVLESIGNMSEADASVLYSSIFNNNKQTK